VKVADSGKFFIDVSLSERGKPRDEEIHLRHNRQNSRFAGKLPTSDHCRVFGYPEVIQEGLSRK
jgi:hypothetical protein